MKLYITLFILLFNLASFAQGDETVHLWPNKVPNEIGSKHEPVQTPDTSRNVIRITNITDPKLIVFKPKDLINNGASIIISPGGSYKYLSINIEGYEIAEWFNELGFTAFVLEYRTPDNRIGALNDIQRSIRIVRSKASSWKIHPNKIGVIGFSAGGNLSAVASTNFNRETYTKIDEIDELSSRPDFALLLYPFSMDNGKNNSLSPNLLIDKNTPPMFIFGTADDKYANGFLVMTKALRDAQVSVELHMIPKGGHGYGMRKENVAGRTWPALAENWLKNILKD